MGLNNMIRLVAANNDLDASKIIRMMNEEETIKDVFKGKTERVVGADISCLIKNDNEDIGFVNLVKEKYDQDFYFLDMGIIKKYQGQGIGKKVFEILLNEKTIKNLKEFIIGETKKTNEKAIGAVENIGGIKVLETEDRVYYLLQKERIEEFIEKDGMQKLGEHEEKYRGLTRREIMNSFY